jgi:septal ring factor EnvC (AmiA/AmiB activator)
MELGNAILLSTLIATLGLGAIALIWARRTGSHEFNEELRGQLEEMRGKITTLENAEKDCREDRAEQQTVIIRGGEENERLRRELIEKEKLAHSLMFENYTLLKQLTDREKERGP